MQLLMLIAKFKFRRQDMKMTLDNVSELTGISKGTLSKLENGKLLNVRISTLWRYANALGLYVTFDFKESKN